MKKQPIRTLSSVWPARPSLHPALKSISARMYRVASSAPCARDCLHAASKSHSAFTHSTSIRSHIVPASLVVSLEGSSSANEAASGAGTSTGRAVLSA